MDPAEEKREHEMLQDIARTLDTCLNPDGEKDIGFVLMLMTLNLPDGTRVNYVSNCDRRDVVSALKEITARLRTN